ncbi:MAG: type II secretion system F family protein [Carboxylicivirga sp.]|nr:type II secretion system F family protein [Carboxylicivirga sp.]
MKNVQGLKINKNIVRQSSQDKTPAFKYFFKKKQKFDDKVKEVFYMELGSMLEAGMDLKTAFDLVIEQQSKDKERKIFVELRNDVLTGASLSEAMQNISVFSPYEYYCIQIGEESGQQLKVISELALFYSNKVQLKRQLVKSLSYPLIIVLTSILAIAFMLTFIVPMFSEIFTRLKGELPTITKVFISLSDSLSSNFWYLFVLITLVVIVLKRLSKTDRYRAKLQTIYLRIPFVGDIILSVYNARFCSSLALLIGARVPLIDSLSLLYKMIDFYPIKNKLLLVKEDVVNGISFSKSLSQHSMLDAKSISMVKIAEEINKLDIFFEKLNQRFTSEVDLKTATLSTLLEPLMIMVLGSIVGLILIAMYLPMFKLGNSML